MMKPNQVVKTTWNNFTKKYYQDLGYIYTRTRDFFYIKCEDLPHQSRVKIKVICDYCGKEFEMFTYAYYKSLETVNKCSCKNCKGLKIRDIMLEKYDVINSMQLDSVKEKSRNTMIERYGVEHALQDREILEKLRQTTFEHYGVYNAMKSHIVQEKSKLVFMEKYGTENIMSLEYFKNKVKQTCIERYGGESSQASAEVRKKSWESMTKNGTIPTSKPESEMVTLLQYIYGEENCFPQFILDRISMDCMIIYKDCAIDVEFDGDFWHKNKEDSDNRRNLFCVNRGYKVLRFRSKGNSPTEKQIKEGVDYLVDSQHAIHKINI